MKFKNFSELRQFLVDQMIAEHGKIIDIAACSTVIEHPDCIKWQIQRYKPNAVRECLYYLDRQTKTGYIDIACVYVDLRGLRPKLISKGAYFLMGGTI